MDKTASKADILYSEVYKVVTELAEKESCIIVGRCADYVLRDHKNHMRVYIYTSYENKYNNCVNNLLINPKEAEKMIKSVDKARKAYHMRYAKYSPDDARYKDILVDSSFLGVEGTAHMLVNVVKSKFNL